MGVPVVTLRGTCHSGRVGRASLQALPQDLIAPDLESYVTIAAEIASDLVRRTELRESLRPRMASSVLCDASRFARNVEAAYFHMCRLRAYVE